MTTPDEVVADYIGGVVAAMMALREKFGGASRTGPVTPLALFAAGTAEGDGGGMPVREGVLEGFGTFSVHGVGCRFVRASGEVIEFDWDAQGREVFDGWRLAGYAASRSSRHLSERDLLDAAHRSPGLVEVRPGWFALSTE